MSYVTAGREIQSEAEVYKKSDMLHFGLQNLPRGLQSCKKTGGGFVGDIAAAEIAPIFLRL